jgi:hypothetical protein
MQIIIDIDEERLALNNCQISGAKTYTHLDWYKSSKPRDGIGPISIEIGLDTFENAYTGLNKRGRIEVTSHE